MTLIQKDILWGRGNNVCVNKADSSTMKSPSTTDPKNKNGRQLIGRPKKPTTTEDQDLIKALQSGEVIDRNERQLNELESLRRGVYN